MEILSEFQANLVRDLEESKIIFEKIDNLNRNYLSKIKHIKDSRMHLCEQIVRDLQSISENKFCTLETLLDGKMKSNKLVDKNLLDDFIYIYKDSMNKFRLIHPLQFTAYKINDPVGWSKGNQEHEEYEEKDMLLHLEELDRSTKNWIVAFYTAESINKLFTHNIPIAHVFVFLDSNRKVSFSVNSKNIIIYERSKVDEDILFSRNKVIQANEYLKSLTEEEE